MIETDVLQYCESDTHTPGTWGAKPGKLVASPVSVNLPHSSAIDTLKN